MTIYMITSLYPFSLASITRRPDGLDAWLPGSLAPCLPASLPPCPASLQVRQLVRQMQGEWQGDDYDLLRRNCTHFARALASMGQRAFRVGTDTVMTA